MRGPNRPARGALILASLWILGCLGAPTASAGESWSEVDARFVRGDADADGRRTISDAVSTLLHLFAGAAAPACDDAADADDNGEVQITDAIYLLGYLFLGGEPLAAPLAECGADPTEDGLGCARFPPCEVETLVASYDLLATVAGRGQIREKGLNGWSAGYEGGPATEAELSRPHMAMADADGNVFIADKDAHAIRKVTPSGTIVTVAGTGTAGDGDDGPGPGVLRELDSPNGMWVRADSTVYILDLGNGKVRRLSPAGELSTLFADPDGISIGRGLWVADDESIVYFASGSRVRRWTPSGGVETLAEGFLQLGNLMLDAEGHVVATDRAASRVWRIAPSGERQPFAGSGEIAGGGDGHPALESALYGVRGVWPHPLGGWLFATHEGSQVWYMDSLGTLHLFLDGRADHSHGGDGESFRTPGAKVSEVRAVTVAPSGDVIVTENDYGFIRVVSRR